LEEGIQIRLIQPGEWLIEVRLDGQLAALFPVYAGIATPEEPLFEADIVGVINEMSATEQLSRKLAEVRDSYGLIPWSSNILLDKAATTGLKPGSSS